MCPPVQECLVSDSIPVGKCCPWKTGTEARVELREGTQPRDSLLKMTTRTIEYSLICYYSGTRVI